MRTTLTLDDDVAARLEQLRKERNVSLRELVNDALRRGLEDVDLQPEPEAVPFTIEPLELGELLIPSLDDISAVLDLLEGPYYK
jgi:hypothetical protein